MNIWHSYWTIRPTRTSTTKKTKTCRI